LRIPLKEGIGGESRGDRGETEGDFTDNSIAYPINLEDFRVNPHTMWIWGVLYLCLLSFNIVWEVIYHPHPLHEILDNNITT
jgi:hypothetical protein